jgi:hypothetical protein
MTASSKSSVLSNQKAPLSIIYDNFETDRLFDQKRRDDHGISMGCEVRKLILIHFKGQPPFKILAKRS